MSGLHFWMQTWSNEGEAMLSGVDSSDNYDIRASTVGSPLADSTLIETSLCQIPHQTTANDALRIVQQVNGQKKLDMQSTGDMIKDICRTIQSAYQTLISNISERDRAEDGEFYHILKSFVRETNKFENRFPNMSDTLLHCRFLCTTVPHNEPFIGAGEHHHLQSYRQHRRSRSRKMIHECSNRYRKISKGWSWQVERRRRPTDCGLDITSTMQRNR